MNNKKIKTPSNFLDEETFLANYNIEEYDRPSVTTDIVAFKIRSETGESYRHNSKSNLSILLVKRGVHPYKDSWALPGGFLRKDETVEECAYREVKEEASVEPNALMPVGVFSNPNRDPRGRIISNAFLSIISETDVEAKGGDDAVEAGWFDVTFDLGENEEYLLTLNSETVELKARLKEIKTLFKKTDYKILDSGSLAFDHAGIIATALSLLRDNAKDFELIFDFLPEKFTLTALQNVQETIMNISLTPANFRRKVSEFVLETEEYTEGAGHRPAKLYTRK